MASRTLGGENSTFSRNSLRGKLNIRAGVVDPNLRVYGTSNLRIVDASIMPLIIGAHLQATVYAIAERVCRLSCVSGLHVDPDHRLQI